MFRIVLYALWSKDYVVPLARVLADALQCSQEESKRLVDRIADRKTLELYPATSGDAYELATNLLQYGAFIEVEQVAPVTDESVTEDAIRLLPEDMSNWYVLIEEENGPVTKFVESKTNGIVTFEREIVTDKVGEELIHRGALPIGPERMAALEEDFAASRAKRVAFAIEMEAKYGLEWRRALYLLRQQREREAQSERMEEE